MEFTVWNIMSGIDHSLNIINPSGGGLLFILNYCLLYYSIRKTNEKTWKKIEGLDKIILTIISSLISMFVFIVIFGGLLFLLVNIIGFSILVICHIIGWNNPFLLLVQLSSAIIFSTVLFSIFFTIRAMQLIIKFYHTYWGYLFSKGFMKLHISQLYTQDNFLDKHKIVTNILWLPYFFLSIFYSTFILSYILGMKSLHQFAWDILNMSGDLSRVEQIGLLAYIIPTIITLIWYHTIIFRLIGLNVDKITTIDKA